MAKFGGNRWLSFLLLLLLAFLLAACAGRSKDGPVTENQTAGHIGNSDDIFHEQDVFEPFNRYIFEVNIFLDTFLMKPLATWYGGMTPLEVRNGVGRFFENLKSPVVLANNLLQGDTEAASITTKRFFLNSSIGFLGFEDIAAKWGYPSQKTDFGLTAGEWGVPHGPYLMLPIFGPATARDAMGIGIDAVFDPLTYNIVSPSWILPGLSSWRIVNTRAALLGRLDRLYRTSVDPYASVRSLYFQGRVKTRKESVDSDIDIDDLPDIEELDF